MVLLYFFALCVFHLAHAQELAHCAFDQGPIDFCQLASNNASNKLTLRLPINARKFRLHRVENAELLDPIIIAENELDKRHFRPRDDLAGCCSDAKKAELFHFVDVSDLKIHDGAWYSVCAEYDSEMKLPVANGAEPHFRTNHTKREVAKDRCIRCAMLKAGAEEAKFLHVSWVQDRLSMMDKEGFGVLRYSTSDMPFSSVTLNLNVIDLQKRESVFHMFDSIRPRQQIFVRIPHEIEPGRYAVITDVQPHDKANSLIKLDDLILTFHDYANLVPEHERKQIPGKISNSDVPVAPGVTVV